ncbi:MAG: hypothetical protein ACJ763_04645 [Bdellovibrionia bacterium]
MTQAFRRFNSAFYAFAASSFALGITSSYAITPHAPVLGIEFDATIPSDQYDLMSRDLEALQKLDLTHPDSKLTQVMGVQDTSTQSLMKWLTDRIHTVVSEDFSPESQTVSNRKFSQFPYPNEFSVEGTITYSEAEAIEPQRPEVHSVTTMSNLGSTLYARSKRAHLIRTISIPGLGNVTITSPRVGILKIGQGLFNKYIAGLGNEPGQSQARVAHQLGILFHEARHSDGHGKSLAFSHVICPPEHHFAGAAACDRSLNGPYTVQAHFLNSLARSCTDCSKRELEMIRMLSADAMSRVVPAITKTAKSDPGGNIAYQLRVLTRTIYLCETSSQMEWTALNPTQSCDNLDALKTRVSQITAAHPDIALNRSQNWDATPERITSPLK